MTAAAGQAVVTRAHRDEWRMSHSGPSRHFGAAQLLGRFRSEAESTRGGHRTGFMIHALAGLSGNIDHCAVPKRLVAGDRQFDRDVRGGAHYPRGSVGLGMALQRFHQQDEFLGKHGRALV
jgi:hypothetical protein